VSFSPFPCLLRHGLRSFTEEFLPAHPASKSGGSYDPFFSFSPSFSGRPPLVGPRGWRFGGIRALRKPPEGFRIPFFFLPFFSFFFRHRRVNNRRRLLKGLCFPHLSSFSLPAKNTVTSCADLPPIPMGHGVKGAGFFSFPLFFFFHLVP